MPDPALLVRLAEALGPGGLLTGGDTAPYVTDWRGAWTGRALAVARPRSTAEVAAVVRLCAEHGASVVPQGGNTGLCGGAVPDDSGAQVVLSLSRMRQVRDVDPVNRTLTVEAGAVLAAVQEAAREAGCLFPLSLGSEGSCTVGGTVATNAGGTGVLRYGSMRQLVLGLEVVLPDGRVWDGLRRLRKDNTGYDLAGLFTGSEGTLGVVTAAVLRLFPAVRRRATAWLAVPDPAAAVTALGVVQDAAGDRLTTFELMSAEALDQVVRHAPGARAPFPEPHPWHVLVELGESRPDADPGQALEAALGEAVERRCVADAVVGSGPAQREALWALREGISEAQNHEGPSLKHDVTVPISDLPAFTARAADALRAALPGIRLVTYGHVGDGNLHYNLAKPPGSGDEEFLARAAELTRLVYDVTAEFDGSISAEHGLGRAKRDLVGDYKPAVELELMQRIRLALDPGRVMNPGAVLPDA